MKEDLQLAPVIRIDGPGAVGESDSEPGSETGSRTDLALHPGREFHDQPCGNWPNLAGLKMEVRVRRPDIVACGMGCGPAWKR